MRRVLLLSSSNVHGRGYLDHAAPAIGSLLGPLSGPVLFLPFALSDWDAYAERARARFAQMGYALESLHRAANPAESVRSAVAFFVGGGNTFRLLNELYRRDLLVPIRHRVSEGVPYVGSSAGSNVAGPTLKTTKDMPIVEPPSFDALGLVDFQISPHYLDPDPASTHMGETQEERIVQYLEENDRPVVGLRESAFLRIEGGPRSREVVLEGEAGCRVFRRGLPPVEAMPVRDIRPLLDGASA
ncbi:MAG: dipeptidase PepE [Acidobacteriota bacterium]|nr:dipeptidase PepE [Acidobacteriota bacterium]